VAQGGGGGPPLKLVVVGGSYVGVELAANLQSWLGAKAEISLVHRADALLATAAEFSRLVGGRRLLESGVNVQLETSVVKVDSDSLTLRGGGGERVVDADMVVWAAGTQPSSLARSLGVPLDSRGRIITDSLLRVASSTKLHALGDVATNVDARGVAPPPTAQTAMQQADYAAWNVRAAMRGERALPYRYAGLGEMLSLGDAQASISALGVLNLQGPLASASRRAVYAARMPTPQQAVRVGLSWAVDVLAKGLGGGATK